jgi:hypothetical protein
MSNEVTCPKCGSTSLSAGKKGFSGKKAVTGAILTGGIGLLAGTIGSNKIEITCLNCGCQFNPKERGEIARATEANRQGKLSQEQKVKVIAAIIAAILVFWWLH